MTRFPARVVTWANFVKFEHTLFSLPMLYAGAVLAASGWPGWWTAAWILAAGTGARTAGFGLNRIIDRQIDADNPRTSARELPRGAMELPEAWGVVAGGLALYIISCGMLPPLCLALAPIPLAAFVGYPYLKRFTSLAHLGVGLALSFAPTGGWLAVTGTLEGSLEAVLLGAYTLFWVAGFDVIYATLDEEFDRDRGLYSLPARLGRASALWVAATFHALAVGALVALYLTELSGALAAAALLAVAVILASEHRLAQRVNLAFFHLNIAVGFMVLLFVITGRAGI